MKKIPTLYLRDFEGTLGPPGRFVLPDLHPDCGWVIAGEGVATRKLDGTCCLIEGGNLYRRHEVKTDKRTGKLKSLPEFFRPVETDPETGHIVGWLPILPANPADVHHWEAFGALCKHWRMQNLGLDVPPPDGTYELLGPSVNGNPEHEDEDTLIPHKSIWRLGLKDVPTGYDDLRAWLTGRDIEGVVWQHPDGRMAKIKGRDFGLTRGQS